MTQSGASQPRSRELMQPTAVFETYWRFAAERQATYFRRLERATGPWTSDPIIAQYRFTNVYRVTDRVTQYLIREIQYRPDRPQTIEQLVFRTLLFKVFNRIETWEAIESALGPVAWGHTDLDEIDRVLTNCLHRGGAIYSAAYIMPSPPFGHTRKHTNHLALLSSMMADDLASKIDRAGSLRAVYELLLSYKGIGRFLAYQYAIDLNYSAALNFSEADFVVAGPGALDGIAKCFERLDSRTPEDVIHFTVAEQDSAFRTLGLSFQTLYGRPLQPIDCQNLFCEISKYARVLHPQHVGIAGRSKIKQQYKASPQPMPRPVFPPRWRLAEHKSSTTHEMPNPWDRNPIYA